MASTFLLAHENRVGNDDDPSRRAIITAIAAIVPSEVIAAAVAVTGFLTVTNNGQTSWNYLDLARVLVAVLAAAGIPVVYWLGSGRVTGRPRGRTIGLVAVSVVAFACWLGLQAPSVYDGWLDLAVGPRAAIVAVMLVILAPIASYLGMKTP
jgi:MFS family permease